VALLTADWRSAEDALGAYETSADDDVFAFGTSGSTGAPKRVLLSRRAVRASARFAAEELGASGAWLLALAPSYVAGFNVVARASEMGTGLVVVAEGSFTAEAFCEAYVHLPSGPNYTSLVPAQLARLLDDVEASAVLAGFARVLLGGQAPPAQLVRRAREAGVRLTLTYGATETSGGCVWDGRPLGDTEVALIDGVIHLTGSVLADGYRDDPEQTAEAFPVVDGRRWHRTRDAGELHGGRLVVVGRVDDVIVSGGVKVPLAAVEALLRDQPGLADAVVVGVPDERWGEVPVVATAGDAEVDAELIAGAYGAAARPARVLRLPELPLLPSGKPDRLAIRALAAAG